jgi:hypothetical protein
MMTSFPQQSTNHIDLYFTTQWGIGCVGGAKGEGPPKLNACSKKALIFVAIRE